MGNDNCSWLRWGSSSNWCIVWILLISYDMTAATKCDSENPSGCDLCEQDFDIRVPNCPNLILKATLITCGGSCHSSAFPTDSIDLQLNPNQTITSKSRCCNIIDSEDLLPYTFDCRGRTKTVTLKKATSCGCTQCDKQ